MSQRFIKAYRDWCVSGTLACAVAGFPDTPFGPLLLWTLVLPALAAGLLRRHTDSAAHPQRPVAPRAQAHMRSAAMGMAILPGPSPR